MSMFIKKVVGLITSVLIFSFSITNEANAVDQTINVDLNNFQIDATVAGYPAYEVYGLSDNDTLIINVTNSTRGVLAYINDSEGNSINFHNGIDIDVTNNTGQFYGVGNLSSLAYDANVLGSLTATIVFGANASLDPAIDVEANLSSYAHYGASNLGYITFNWTNGDDLTVQRRVVFLSSGTALFPTTRPAGNLLRLDAAATVTEKNNVVSCSPGKYTFLDSGATAEAAKIQSFVYTLLVNGKAVSTLSTDNFATVDSSLFPTLTGGPTGTATVEGATWDLKGMSNYSAQCQIYATQSGAALQTTTTAVYDVVALTAQAEAAAAAQKVKDMIANWASANEELAKKYRDNRLAGKG